MSPDRPMSRRQLRTEFELADGQPPGPRPIHDHITRPVVQRLVKAEAHTVLDLGCGNGWFTGALDRCGFDVTGADHNEAELQIARQHYPHVRLHQMDLMRPLDSSLMHRFDAVVAIDLIDHVPLPRKLIEAALCALRPGGLLVVTATFHGYTKNLVLALTGRFDLRWEPLLDHGRMKFFSRSTLSALLSEFDLHDVHFQTVGRIPMFARSMLISAQAPT